MKNIVLCGSMKVKERILAIAEQLKQDGYNVLLPKECINNEPKATASRAHMKRIIDESNSSILIVNERKNGIDNYIGPNSFAEIAFGYYFNKKVFLLNDIYEPYEDELIGWGVIPLHGNLAKLNDYQ